ncbi:MAG: nuclear transport factor 2 family protein [Nitrososphaeraceae archaeon]
MITNIFKDWLSAFQLHNVQKMVSNLTDDVKIESLVFGTHFGKDAATNYWELLYRMFPKIKITLVTITADVNRLVAEIDITGIERQKVNVSTTTSDGTRIRGAFVYEFVNDKIKEIRMYYDSTILKRQLEMSNETGEKGENSGLKMTTIM